MPVSPPDGLLARVPIRLAAFAVALAAAIGGGAAIGAAIGSEGTDDAPGEVGTPAPEPSMPQVTEVDHGRH